MSWIDLHMHSNLSSDGEFAPERLMELCAGQGIRVAALADHNCTAGVARARARALALGVELVPAVELDCTFRGVNLHLLGYWIDPAAPGFGRAEQEVLRQERDAAAERVRLVQDLGLHVDLARALKLSYQGMITGEVIAEVALKSCENDGSPLLEPYRAGGARADNPYVNFYWDFCAQGKPAYVPIHYQSLDEAIALIRGAGGIPVLAHPGNNVHEDEALLRGILERGVDGMEAYSSYHSPEQTAFYRERALAMGLAVSCGSDFHGKTKPNISLGSAGCGGSEQALLDGLSAKRDGGGS